MSGRILSLPQPGARRGERIVDATAKRRDDQNQQDHGECLTDCAEVLCSMRERPIVFAARHMSLHSDVETIEIRNFVPLCSERWQRGKAVASGVPIKNNI
jgi:hypothetical protein